MNVINEIMNWKTARVAVWFLQMGKTFLVKKQFTFVTFNLKYLIWFTCGCLYIVETKPTRLLFSIRSGDLEYSTCLSLELSIPLPPLFLISKYCSNKYRCKLEDRNLFFQLGMLRASGHVTCFRARHWIFKNHESQPFYCCISCYQHLTFIYFSSGIIDIIYLQFKPPQLYPLLFPSFYNSLFLQLKTWFLW